jgi:hypothetical protein
MSKRLSIFILLLFFSAGSFAQSTRPSQEFNKEHYLKLSKSQKTGGWILLGGGTALVSAGIGIGFGQAVTQIGNIFSTEPQKTSNSGEVLFYTGLAAMAGSIPFFIASSKNRKKANALSASFKMESRSTVQQRTIVPAPYPAVSIKFSL